MICYIVIMVVKLLKVMVFMFGNCVLNMVSLAKNCFLFVKVQANIIAIGLPKTSHHEYNLINIINIV